MYQPVVEIDLNALQHNLAKVRQFAPQAKVLAMVKADGYGHGLVEVARSLHEADALGVARASEAQILIAAGVNTPLVLMEGCLDQDELTWAIKNHVQLTIQNQQQLDAFLALGCATPSTVWLKLDTGMHRLGFEPTNFIQAYEQLVACQHCQQIVNMMHFACADDLSDTFNESQYELFEQFTAKLDAPQSVANSATILSRPERQKDWVRPGIVLYGTSPVIGTESLDFDLKPVMTLRANVIAIKPVKQGQSVGYGRDWFADRDSVIAVLGVGYGDGYPRHAKNGTPVLVKGQRVPLVGRVSMDMITVDVTDLAKIEVGDPVTLWGDNLPSEDVARCADTLSYTLYCGITNRVKRVYV